MEDKQLICLCGEEFTWSKGEQEFMNELYAQGKITEVFEPKRCQKCRIEKRRKYN